LLPPPALLLVPHPQCIVSPHHLSHHFSHHPHLSSSSSSNLHHHPLVELLPSLHLLLQIPFLYRRQPPLSSPLLPPLFSSSSLPSPPLLSFSRQLSYRLILEYL